MKIEAGKYYWTRGGDVVGPMAQGNDKRYPWIIFSGIVNSLRWNQDGDYSYAGEHSLDLVAEVYVSDTPPDAPLPDTITDQPCKTLRDEFAMAALTGNMANPNIRFQSFDEMATESYQMADAMMKARKK
jgi:hypothetical protein